MTPTTPHRRPARPRRGFSFTEVLFAVMVLGIGFILIAAMFPVTIRQTANTMEDTVGANIAKAAVEYLQGVASEETFPATGTAASVNPAPVVSFTDDSTNKKAWYASRGDYVSAQNPRYAWVPLYRREADSAFAQIFVVVVQSRNRPQYFSSVDPDDASRKWTDVERFGGNPSTLEPRKVKVKITKKDAADETRGSQADFSADALGKNVAAAGAYVIVAEGPQAGRIFRLGGPTNDADADPEVYDLVPGSDLLPTDPPAIPTGSSVDAYVIGRGSGLTPDVAPSYEGNAQDIAIYTTFIRVN